MDECIDCGIKTLDGVCEDCRYARNTQRLANRRRSKHPGGECHMCHKACDPDTDTCESCQRYIDSVQAERMVDLQQEARGFGMSLMEWTDSTNH